MVAVRPADRYDMTTLPPPGKDDGGVTMGELRIEVTNDDIRAAKRAWLAADGGAVAAARVEQLRWGYQQLVHTQAQQIAEGFRAQGK